MTGRQLPIVDTCYVSGTPGGGYVMARDVDEPVEASRRFPITQMIDGDGDLTDDPAEAKVVIFGSDYFGWCTYELFDAEPATIQ